MRKLNGKMTGLQILCSKLTLKTIYVLIIEHKLSILYKMVKNMPSKYVLAQSAQKAHSNLWISDHIRKTASDSR